MNDFVNRLVKNAEEKGIILNNLPDMPKAHISCAELYLTFCCNDICEHCITESGGDRKESMSPENADIAVEHISKYSILNSLSKLFGNGEYRYNVSDQCKELDNTKKPPKKLSFPLIQKYNVCAMGRDGASEWVNAEGNFKLNFRKPAIRLSGGEFYMWPQTINGRKLSVDERLLYQQELIGKICSKLPDYDIWILTNGRFAANEEITDKVIGSWAKYANTSSSRSKIRICISVDVFHRPPSKSSIEDMLKKIWKSSWKYGFMAPHLYGIPNQSIGLIGRAIDNFKPGRLDRHKVNNVSKSSFNPLTYIMVDPYNLVENGGCQETKGFIIENGEGNMFVHNIYIKPTGEMAYCCACVGSYGNFIENPIKCLKNIVSNPLVISLRRKETIIPLLKLAVEMDPTIKIFGSGENAEVTGSTCYQVLSGKRLK